MIPVISTMYEMQSQFDQMEEGRLNESLLYTSSHKFARKFV